VLKEDGRFTRAQVIPHTHTRWCLNKVVRRAAPPLCPQARETEEPASAKKKKKKKKKKKTRRRERVSRASTSTGATPNVSERPLHGMTPRSAARSRVLHARAKCLHRPAFPALESLRFSAGILEGSAAATAGRTEEVEGAEKCQEVVTPEGAAIYQRSSCPATLSVCTDSARVCSGVARLHALSQARS